MILGDTAAAVPYCIEATKRDPANYACYELLGLLYERRQELTNAMRWYKEGLDHVKRLSYRAMFWRRLGDIAFKENNLEKATIAYQSAILENQYETAAHQGLAQVFAAQGHLSAAVESLKRAIQLERAKDKSIPSLWFRDLGEYHEKQGDLAQAIEAYLKAVENDPNNIGVLKRIQRLLGKIQ